MLTSQPASIIAFRGGYFGPQGSYQYFAVDGDNWGNIASRDGWTNPTDLCEYNFRTRNPKEIN